jgi:hypothetical protein
MKIKSVVLGIIVTTSVFIGCTEKEKSKDDFFTETSDNKNHLILEETPSNYIYLINNNLKYAKKLGKSWGITKNMSANEIAKIVMKRVSGIPYEDYSPGGKSPQKTINDNLGDCEDKSILAASVLKAFSIRTILISRASFTINKESYQGHVYLGLLTNSKENSNMKCAGQDFIPFDATKKGAIIGKMDGYYNIDQSVRQHEKCYKLN